MKFVLFVSRVQFKLGVTLCYLWQRGFLGKLVWNLTSKLLPRIESHSRWANVSFSFLGYGLQMASAYRTVKRCYANTVSWLLPAADSANGNQSKGERLVQYGPGIGNKWHAGGGHAHSLGRVWWLPIIFHQYVDKLLSLNYPQSNTSFTSVRYEIHYCLSYHLANGRKPCFLH